MGQATVAALPAPGADRLAALAPEGLGAGQAAPGRPSIAAGKQVHELSYPKDLTEPGATTYESCVGREQCDVPVGAGDRSCLMTALPPREVTTMPPAATGNAMAGRLGDDH